MSDATKARTAGVISASISGGTIIGWAVVDDIIIYVVTEIAVRVQISFCPAVRRGNCSIAGSVDDRPTNADQWLRMWPPDSQ
jgi:hypothetical protein